MTLNKSQQKLANWLEVYALHCQMGDEESACLESADAPDFSKEALPEEGQIRLWPAVNLQMAPMYGLLISAGYARWRVFPFSPFLIPALPQELLMTEEGPARVLEGWNARELNGKQVAGSWVVGQVADEKLFLVHRWWLMLTSGEEEDQSFGELLGPPLRHPLDPRHTYLESESCRADACLAESPAAYKIAERLDLAAEPDTPYGKKSENDDEE